MRYRSIQPSAHLKPYLQKFCYIEFDCREYLKQCNLPASHTIICFQIGRDEPTLRYHGTELFTGRNYICGPMRHPLYIEKPGKYCALIALFTELGGYYLFKIPQCEYADRLFSLSEFIGHSVANIADRIESSGDIATQLRLVEQFVTKFYETRVRTIPSLEYAIEKISRTYSTRTITEVCRELSCSLRTIERQFQYYMGTTPKEFARMARLSEVYKSLINHSDMRIHDLIDRLGYYDQAHLIRDLKSYAGVTPSRFQNHAQFITPYLTEEQKS